MIQMLQEADRSALMTFIGTALIKFAGGIIGIWGTINIYFFSYLKHNGTNITPTTNSFILLCVVVPSAFAMLSSTTLSRKFGYKAVIKICAIVFSTVPWVLNIKLTTLTLSIFYLLIPISCITIASVPVLNCLWSQFPQHLNKVSGIAVLFFALGAIVFNLLFTFLANPENEKAVIGEDGQAFFSKEIAQNVFKAANVVVLICGICYVTGSFLVEKRYEEEKVQQLAEESPPPQSVGKEFTPFKTQERIFQSKNRKEQAALSTTLRDKKFIILFLISLCTPLYIIYLTLYMKLIFMPIINDDYYLASCAVSVTISAMFGAPFWGYMGDQKGFKPTLLIILVIDVICKVLGLFCVEKWNILLLYFCLGFNDKGVITIIGPGLIEIFGLEMATELIPYKGLSLFIAYMVVPAIQLFLSSSMTYQHILMLFLFFTVVSLALSLYFSTRIRYTKYAEMDRITERQEYQQNKIDKYIT